MSVTTRTEKWINALLALLAFLVLYSFAQSSGPSSRPVIELNRLEIPPLL